MIGRALLLLAVLAGYAGSPASAQTKAKGVPANYAQQIAGKLAPLINSYRSDLKVYDAFITQPAEKLTFVGMLWVVCVRYRIKTPTLPTGMDFAFVFEDGQIAKTVTNPPGIYCIGTPERPFAELMRVIR